MKKYISLPLLAGLVLACTYSCEKSNEDLADNSNNSMNFSSPDLSYSLPTATRKGRSITVTDLQTGKKRIIYDCTETGTSCDIGEVVSPPPTGTSGRMDLNVASRRQTFISEHSNKPSNEVVNLLLNQKSTWKDIFPKFYDPEIEMQLRTGSVEIISSELYLALVEKGNPKNPLYVYYAPGQLISKAPIKDSFEWRRAKLNLENNKLECIESGDNCLVRLRGNPNLSSEELPYIIKNHFKDESLYRLILDGKYRLYESEDHIEITPVSTGVKYYIKK